MDKLRPQLPALLSIYAENRKQTLRTIPIFGLHPAKKVAPAELAIFGIQYQGAERDPVSLVIMQSVPSARLDHRERLLRLVDVVDHEVRGSFRP